MLETRGKRDVTPVDVSPDRELTQSSSVIDLTQLLRVARRESRSLTRSLAREMARSEGQARLDTFRADRAMKIAQDVAICAVQRMSAIDQSARLLVEEHPEVAADIEEMVHEAIGLCRQMPKVTTVGYTRRNFQSGQHDGDC